MRFKQANPQHNSKQNYRRYSAKALRSAYQQCMENNMRVKKAAKIYNVPVTTLRDRVLCRIDPDAIIGSAPLFSKLQEAKLVKHFKTMASYGYGYTRQESVDIASGYATQLGLRSKDKPLTLKWIRGFLRRWPELKVLKSRGLEYARARMASESTVNDYFKRLSETLEAHDLIDKPHLIFNVDEKGVTTNHKPPYVVASESYCPQVVTSGKGKTVTILGCGSASGMSIPPFFVFPGKRMNSDLLLGKSPGADAAVSESGWSNHAIFRQYLITHFLKYVPGRDGQKVLLILDGHKSHISVGLSEWAMDNGIVLFILPAHTSHILQPLDVSCYGPFEKIYNAEVHKLMRQTQATITRYNVCEVACRVYTKALTAENLQSAYKRSGIFPLNPQAIPKECLVPAEIYHEEEADACTDNQDSQETVEGGICVSVEEIAFQSLELKEKQLKETKSKRVQKPRKTMSKVVAGKEINKEVIEKMKEHIDSVNKKEPKRKQQVKKETKTHETKKKQKIGKSIANASPVQGPSHYNLVSDSDFTPSDDDDDDDVCCVCGKFTPVEVSKSVSLVFTKWAQCDGKRNGIPCKHWVHLIYCTPVRVIRKGDHFFCHHCKTEE